MAYPLLDQYGVSSKYGPRANLYGDFHYGTDIPTPVGVPVPCIAGGTVVLAGPITFSYGGKFYTENVVCVNRDDGKANLYDHLSRVDVRVGQRVEKGVIVGQSGKSGYVTGPHLHIQKMTRHYTGGKFANYPTEDPEPELRTWSPAQGDNEDMTWLQFVDAMYATYQKDSKPSDEVRQAHAAHLATLDANGVAAWMRRFALDGRWADWPETNALALTSYADATGKGEGNPRQWAVDRFNGGDTFDAVIHRDMAESQRYQQGLEQRVRELETQLDQAQKPVPTPQPDHPQETPKEDEKETPKDALTLDEVGFVRRLYYFFADILLGR
jgi:hypothetical protein